jgi:hypothetical protein
MLGMGDVWSKDASAKDSSSSKESSFTSTLIRRSSSCHEIYYQKMREKNNEASKRCRMKRRLKAVSLEGHLDLLVLSNEMLKDRLSRTEKICSVIREAIKNIQPEGCSCIQAHEIIKQVNGKVLKVQIYYSIAIHNPVQFVPMYNYIHTTR